MPRRSYPPTQSWRTFLRNQALGIGMIGLGEAGRISDQLLTLVRGWIERVVRCATKVRDGISCRLIEPPWPMHPLRPSRSSNGNDRRVIHGGCMPVRPRRTAQGGDPLDYGRSTTFTVSLTGITETEAACTHESGENAEP